MLRTVLVTDEEKQFLLDKMNSDEANLTREELRSVVVMLLEVSKDFLSKPAKERMNVFEEQVKQTVQAREEGDNVSNFPLNYPKIFSHLQTSTSNLVKTFIYHKLILGFGGSNSEYRVEDHEEFEVLVTEEEKQFLIKKMDNGKELARKELITVVVMMLEASKDFLDLSVNDRFTAIQERDSSVLNYLEIFACSQATTKNVLNIHPYHKLILFGDLGKYFGI